MGSVKVETYLRVLAMVVLICTATFCSGVTDSRDVETINNLYVSLGYPPLRGWLLVGGDPCGDGWQGVECVFSNITELNLSGLNLGGKLGDTLDFASILSIDFSNNHITGSVPSNLPPTVVKLSLGNNLLSGEIPDSLQELGSLLSLDLSHNNLTSKLPPSFANLSALTTLNMQNNKLIGTLDVLEDLPLIELNVEDNLFWGPIPSKLLMIPVFRRDGNPFNTSVIPSPPAPPAPAPAAAVPSSASAPSIVGPPPTQNVPPKRGGGGGTGGASPAPPHSTNSKGGLRSKNVISIAVLGATVLVAITALSVFCWRHNKKKQANGIGKKNDMAIYANPGGTGKTNGSLQQPNKYVKGAPKWAIAEPPAKNNEDVGRLGSCNGQMDEHQIDMTGMLNLRQKKDQVGDDGLQPAVSPLTLLPAEEFNVNPVTYTQSTARTHSAEKIMSSSSVKKFSIASLQEFTNSFSPEHFIGQGKLASVYKAMLPDGQLVAVKKLKTRPSRQQSEKRFLDLVSTLSKLRHGNIVELVGYCAEHGQRLLVYKYCRNGTLHDALHVDDEVHENLSWNTRIHVALGAARALEYLHEACQPPVMHRNFNSVNILLDDKLEVRISDCGLAPLISYGSETQLSEHLPPDGYTAPETESGTYSFKSDVYSFGVVMLELLTGRKALDRERPKGEQYLVRWAQSRLHDIDALSKMVDPSLCGFYPTKSLSRFADIISRCVQLEPEFRPPMSEVVQDLLRMV